MSIGGDKEITLYTNQHNIAGVISENPGLKLNNDLENGTFIALKGKVPCKISSPVKKGQFIIADTNGMGRGVDFVSPEYTFLVVGVALEDSTNSKVMIKV